MGNSCSVSQCSNIERTDVNSWLQNRHLQFVTSGSDASSTMLPTELAVSESVSDMSVLMQQIQLG